MSSYTSERRAIWANATGSSIFHVLVGPVATADAAAASWQLYVRESTQVSDLQVVVAYEFSDDGHTWTTGGDLGTLAGTSSGWTFATAFTALTGPTKRWVRFGLRAKKSANATLAYARALLIIELRACA
jgi:hypothetical protein